MAAHPRSSPIWSPGAPARASLGLIFAVVLTFLTVLPASAGSNGWTRVGLAGKSIDVVAVAPTDPNLLIVTVETERDGIYRSVDRGKTWQRVYGGGNRASSEALNGYRGIGFDPQNANIVYVFGGSGLMRSVDAGQTWNRAFDGVVCGFAVDSQRPSTIYLCEEKTASVMRSADRGKTWQKILQTDESFGVEPDNSAIAVNPADPSYLVVAGIGYRSTDGGTTWQKVSTGGAFSERVSSVAFSRDGKTLFGLINGSGLVVRSLDGGMSWRKAIADGITFLLPNPSDAADIFVIGPDGRQIFRSNDGGVSLFQTLPPPSEHGNPFYALDRASPQTLYGPTQDGLWAYTFATRADSLPRSGDPLPEVLPILAALATALSLVGLRLRVRTQSLQVRAPSTAGPECYPYP